MDTSEEEFALMRESFLRAALGEAEASGGPSSRVRLRRVAEALSAEDLSGEAGPALMQRYAAMAGHYRETGDLSDLDVSGGEAVFRLTARGIAEAEGEG
jgi:hypothetical protein